MDDDNLDTFTIPTCIIVVHTSKAPPVGTIPIYPLFVLHSANVLQLLLVLCSLLYNAIPTMLQRSGIGVPLGIITVGFLYVMNPMAGCMMESLSEIHVPVSSERFYISAMLQGIAKCILERSFLEFALKHPQK